MKGFVSFSVDLQGAGKWHISNFDVKKGSDPLVTSFFVMSGWNEAMRQDRTGLPPG